MNNNKNSCKGFLNILNEFIIKNYKKFYITMGNGKNKKKIEKRLYSIFTKAFILIAIIFLIEILFVLGFLIFEKDHNPQSILDLLGPFGDFFGGMLNPILTFCTFMALLMTIILQQRELKLSREQVAISVKELGETRKATEISSQALTEQSKSLQIQNFENTFFNMINLHNEIVDNLKIKEHFLDYKFYKQLEPNAKYAIYSYFDFVTSTNSFSKIFIGREAIEYISYNIDNFLINRNRSVISKEGYAYPQGSTYTSSYINLNRKPTLIYDLCHEYYSNVIGHYFGNIYQILKFISTSKIKNKQKYSDLFRAQFSSQELKLLFYHCCGSIGIKKFKPLIEEFEFLEHLKIEEDNNFFKYIFYHSLYNNEAFGYKNSDIIESLSIEDGDDALEKNHKIELLQKEIITKINFDINKIDKDQIYMHYYLYKYFSNEDIKNYLINVENDKQLLEYSVNRNLLLLDYSEEDNTKNFILKEE